MAAQKHFIAIKLMHSLTAWLAIIALSVTTAEISAQTATNADLPDWENPLVFGINMLPPRCPAWPCPDAESGWKSSYDSSPWVQSLDGDWTFHWSPDPGSRGAQRIFDATWNVFAKPHDFNRGEVAHRGDRFQTLGHRVF